MSRPPIENIVKRGPGKDTLLSVPFAAHFLRGFWPEYEPTAKLYEEIRNGKFACVQHRSAKYVRAKDVLQLLERKGFTSGEIQDAEEVVAKYKVRQAASRAKSLERKRMEAEAAEQAAEAEQFPDAPDEVDKEAPLFERVTRQLGQLFPGVTDHEHRVALIFYTLALIYQQRYGPMLAEHEHILVAAVAETYRGT